MSSSKYHIFEQFVRGRAQTLGVFRGKHLDGHRSTCQLTECLELRFYAAARRYPSVFCNQFGALGAQQEIQQERGSVRAGSGNRNGPRLGGGNGGGIGINNVDRTSRALYLRRRVQVELDPDLVFSGAQELRLECITPSDCHPVSRQSDEILARNGVTVTRGHTIQPQL